jgi:hypothetical protein
MDKIDRIINHFRNLREDGVPTMNTASAPGAPGFSAYSNSAGPTAGTTPGLGKKKLDGRSKIMRRLPPTYRQFFNKTRKK